MEALAFPPSPDTDTDPNVPNNQEHWTWCVENADELAICSQMVKILQSIDTDSDHVHACVQGSVAAVDSCMKRIQEGSAMFAVFVGMQIWSAYNDYGLVPVRTDYSDVDDTGRSYSVAVVNANNCPKSLADLQGMASCHTNYGQASGWILPVAYLTSKKIMPVVTLDASKPHDLQSVAAFFSKSCATNENKSEEICTACKTRPNCSEDDAYSDFPGAFRCLVERSGDVAFTKGVIPSMYSKGGIYEQANWSNLKDATQYKILCPNATISAANVCTEVINFKSCNFGSAPGNTIMVSRNIYPTELAEFHDLMDDALNNAAFVKLFSGENATTSNTEFAWGVWRSTFYNGTIEDLLGTLYTSIRQIQKINAETSSSKNSNQKQFMKDTVPTLAMCVILLFSIML